MELFHWQSGCVQVFRGRWHHINHIRSRSESCADVNQVSLWELVVNYHLSIPSDVSNSHESSICHHQRWSDREPVSFLDMCSSVTRQQTSTNWFLFFPLKTHETHAPNFCIFPYCAVIFEAFSITSFILIKSDRNWFVRETI